VIKRVIVGDVAFCQMILDSWPIVFGAVTVSYEIKSLYSMRLSDVHNVWYSNDYEVTTAVTTSPCPSDSHSVLKLGM